MSGDLITESTKDPWRQIGSPGDKDFGDLLKFVCEKSDGDTDIAMAFDGLSRTARRSMEDIVGQMSSAAEVSLTYTKAPNCWCMRRNFFGSKNMEVAYIAMPANRTRLTVGERQGSDSFSGAGEDSTHYTTYTGVPHLLRNRLALIDAAEKAKIIGGDAVDPATLPDSWQKTGKQGVPLYWMETKSVETWTRILKDTKVKAVLDLTAGSGNLACACMGVGALYTGFVYHRTHLTWLTNVVDRAAMKYITESGTYLYQEDLATHIKQVFMDLVDPEEVDADQLGDEDDEEE